VPETSAITSFIFHIEPAVEINLGLSGLTLEDGPLLAYQITRLIAEKPTARSIRAEMKRFLAPLAATQQVAVRAFIEWLVLYVRCKAEGQSWYQPCGSGKPAKLRLHIVGRGHVGKNFQMTRLRAAYRREISPTPAKNLNYSRAVALCSTYWLPTFITRDAQAKAHHQHIERPNQSPCVSLTPATTIDSACEQHNPQDTVCHLLGLPAEIRNLIYEYTLAHDSEVEVSDVEHAEDAVNLLTATPPSPALSLTCKQIHEECRKMYLENFKRFWKESNFYVNASTLPTGWHVRPILRRLPQRDLERIEMLRVELVAGNGAYDAFLHKEHWFVDRCAGPDPSQLGIGGLPWGFTAPGSSEVVMISQAAVDDGSHTEYEMIIADEDPQVVAEFVADLEDGTLGRLPVRDQLCALIETLNIW
jgi:hypothetical protein